MDDAPSILQAIAPDLRRLEALRAAREPLTPELARGLGEAIREAQDALGRPADALERRSPV